MDTRSPDVAHVDRATWYVAPLSAAPLSAVLSLGCAFNESTLAPTSTLTSEAAQITGTYYGWLQGREQCILVDDVRVLNNEYTFLTLGRLKTALAYH